MTAFPHSPTPIPRYRPIPYGGAVQADGITSANTVGYSGATINADQWYMVGVQFADVASATEVANFNSFISTTCTLLKKVFVIESAARFEGEREEDEDRWKR